MLEESASPADEYLSDFAKLYTPTLKEPASFAPAKSPRPCYTAARLIALFCIIDRFGD